jgi:hypothetical protein
MKRFFFVSSFGVGAVVLLGCPIYPDNAGHRYCNASGCYSCPGDYYSQNDCSSWQCNSSSDCPSGYSCDNSGYCVPGSSGAGGGGGTGAGGGGGSTDCSQTGCPSGYVCALTNGTLACIPAGMTDGGTSGDSGAPSGCQSANDCTSQGAGAQCIDGVCTPAQNVCFDTTQCPNNEQCVQGVCTPSCNADNPCPTGYSCDTSKGVCTGNPTPCTDSSQCTGGDVCVEQHCVPPCGANNSCPTGLVCVEGGCIPDQKPQFVCGADGTQGDGGAGQCANGSICLHHNCYIECSGDAGPDGGGCNQADRFNICKSVTTSSGTYDVCGSNSNLGGQCDPTQNQNCTSPAICIDGYCK